MRIAKPISTEEADDGAVSFEPWPAGEYDFTVAEATDDRSGAGHEMIKLTLHVFNRTGARRVVFDYLSASPKAQWKVRHFAEAMHMVRQYDAGELNPDDMLGKPGRCYLRVQAPEGSWGAKNTVGDYIVAKKGLATELIEPSRTTRGKAPAGSLDDEIPF